MNFTDCCLVSPANFAKDHGTPYLILVLAPRQQVCDSAIPWLQLQMLQMQLAAVHSWAPEAATGVATATSGCGVNTSFLWNPHSGQSSGHQAEQQQHPPVSATAVAAESPTATRLAPAQAEQPQRQQLADAPGQTSQGSTGQQRGEEDEAAAQQQQQLQHEAVPTSSKIGTPAEHPQRNRQQSAQQRMAVAASAQQSGASEQSFASSTAHSMASSHVGETGVVPVHAGEWPC